MPFGAESTLARILTTRAIGIPCPEPLALIRPARPGWIPAGPPPADAAGWAGLLDALPVPFAVRPTERTFGTRLAVFDRRGETLRDQYGRHWSPGDLAELLLRTRDVDGWIVEAHVPDHPMLVRLARAGPMPAVVALTLLGPDEVPVLLSADLSREPPGGPRSARRHGEARDLVAIDTATGLLAGAGPGALLPSWTAVLALVARCARSLPDHRAMGWDVLITTRGPMLAAVWSPWWGAAGVRARRTLEGALHDRALGRDPLGERLEP